MRNAKTGMFIALFALVFVNLMRADTNASSPESPAPYTLQANDEIFVHSIQVKELAEKTFRLDQRGEVNFPLAGLIRLEGLSVRQAESSLAAALKRFYKDPDIEVNVTTYHQESISVLGSVGTPGVYQLKSGMRLVEALSAAGGVRGDAGPTVTVTRQRASGPIDDPNARQNLNGSSVVEIDLKSLLDVRESSENIEVRPHDVISIPAAQLVYVLGNVKKAGGFPMAGRPNLTVLQAVALAEGLDPRASPEQCRILRRGLNSEEQVRVDVKAILAGRTEDVLLRPNDILFVPSNTMKVITTRTIEAAIQIGTGLAIFRP